MKIFTPEELKEILRKHELWLQGKEDGVRADLSYANLSYVKDDLFYKLGPLKSESVELYKAVVDGKIDGSFYEGECCCFVGTIAKNMNIKYQEIENLKPDSSSPIERIFMGISSGDTPENNPVSRIVKDWLEEFMNTNGIKIPERKVDWI